MRALVLGGFLGSGKTTVLLQLARYLVAQTPYKETALVIIENEISQNDVDGKLLAQNSLSVENLFAGCACCSGSGQLCDTIRQIQKRFDPEWIIIEASGVAYPDSIQQTLREELGMEAGMLAIVDVKRWRRVQRAMGPFVQAQLNGVQVVLLTKIDLVTEDIVQEVASSAAQYAPQAKIYPICALEQHSDLFWSGIIQQLGRVVL